MPGLDRYLAEARWQVADRGLAGQQGRLQGLEAVFDARFYIRIRRIDEPA